MLHFISPSDSAASSEQCGPLLHFAPSVIPPESDPSQTERSGLLTQSRLQDSIDRSFMSKFNDLPSMTEALPEHHAVARASGAEALALLSALPMRCAGCGSKVGCARNRIPCMQCVVFRRYSENRTRGSFDSVFVTLAITLNTHYVPLGLIERSLSACCTSLWLPRVIHCMPFIGRSSSAWRRWAPPFSPELCSDSQHYRKDSSLLM